MRHTIRLHGVIVGHSELEHIDADLGRAWGEFRPGLGYELVEPIFRLFSEAAPPGGTKDNEKLQRYYKARDALALELQSADGVTIPTTVVHIADYRPEKGSIELDVLIPDEGYWRSRLDG